MSDPIDDLLAARAAQAPAPAQQDPIDAILAARAAGHTLTPPPADPNAPISPNWDKATEAHLLSPSTWLGPVARYAVGGAEALGAGAAGLGVQAAAGLTGLGRAGLAYITGDDPQAAFKAGTDTINNLASHVPLEPETTAGRDLYQKLGLIGDAIKAGGDYAYDKTGSPLIGAGAQAAGTLASFLIPAKVGEAIGKLKDSSSMAAPRTPIEQSWETGNEVSSATQGHALGEAATNVPPDIGARVPGGRTAQVVASPEGLRAAEQAFAEKVGPAVNYDVPAFVRNMGKAPPSGAPVPDPIAPPNVLSQAASAPRYSTPWDTLKAPTAKSAAAPTEADMSVPDAVLGAADHSGETVIQRHAESQSLPVPIDLTRGQATGDIHQLSFEQNNRARIPELADRFNQQNEALRANLDEIRNRVAPDVNVTGVATDQALVDAIKAADAPVRADISAKYQALQDANGGDFPLSSTDFVAAADKNLKAQNKGYFLPAEMKGLMDDYRNGGQMTYNDFENLRTILGAEARKAERAGDGNAEHAISIVRNSLESLPMTNETAAIKPLADAARAAAAERFGRIATDPAYKAAVTDGVPMGEASPIADGFIGKYVVNGKTANVRNLINNVAAEPAARQIISAGVLDHLKQASGIDLRTNTGNVSQAGLNKAITALGEKKGIVLDPESARHIDTLGNVARYTQQQPRGSYVNNSHTLVGDLTKGAKEVAGSALEGYANAKVPFFNIGTRMKSALGSMEDAKAIKKMLEPGAGTPKEVISTKSNPDATSTRSSRSPGIIAGAMRASAPVLLIGSAGANKK